MSEGNSLGNYMKRCTCGKLLTRRAGESVKCMRCGADWHWPLLTLPQGHPKEEDVGTDSPEREAPPR